MVGRASTLRNDQHWKNLIEAADGGGSLFKVSKPYSSFFTDDNLDTMKVKEQTEEMETEADNAAPMFDNAMDADAAQPDDDYGDGDADFGEGGDD